MADVLAALFAFALMVAYWPGIAGVATTPRWDVAALLSIAMFVAPKVRMTAAHWAGLALVVWMLLGLIWNDGGADGRADGIDAAVEMVIAATAFAVGSAMLRIDVMLAGAVLGIGVNSGFAIAQWFGYFGPIQTIDNHDGAAMAHSYAGLFYNPNGLAAAAAIVGLGILAYRKLWPLLPLVAPSLMLAQSRAAWLSVLVGLFVMRPQSAVLRWGGRVVVLGAAAAALIMRPLGSASERLMIWQDTIGHINWFGHGLGSFREDFIQFAHAFNIAAQQSRPEHPHNEWLWFLFEGGVPALVLAVVLALLVWRAGRDRPELGLLAGLFVLSGFAMPFHDPATVVLGALCAGHLVGRAALGRDGAVDRRGLLRPWLAAESDRARHRGFAGGTAGVSVPAEVS